MLKKMKKVKNLITVLCVKVAIIARLWIKSEDLQNKFKFFETLTQIIGFIRIKIFFFLQPNQINKTYYSVIC
jgi:hypothetical protein